MLFLFLVTYVKKEKKNERKKDRKKEEEMMKEKKNDGIREKDRNKLIKV